MPLVFRLSEWLGARRRSAIMLERHKNTPARATERGFRLGAPDGKPYAARLSTKL